MGVRKALKEKIREEYGTHVSFAGCGEMIPNDCIAISIRTPWTDLHPGAALHFAEPARDQAGEPYARYVVLLIETMGGKVTRPKRPAHDTDWISMPGTIIHEAGTVRMGDDPKKSALNKFNQAHDVKNLFVMDAAPFVSQPDKNVTLSIVAFAWRASEYLAEEMRKGNV